ncbi:MAG TPA: PEP/pyruvate-binding domain-containing protein [Solirubrobacteraceae bacterium]|nr:PEP/pyruvate-binding domain-containing protein [Solirubrobacteraceae bacterium]
MSRQEVHALRTHDADAPEVLWLGEPRAADAALTGGKAANLSRLAAAFDVPPGFVLAVPGAELPRSARATVARAYRRLAALTGVDEPAVAVRSSAVDEDGLDASFAGQHDTFLNVSGADQLWWAICRCVASFGADRALAYRRDAGLPEAPERVAVLVQWLVPADAAGVVFSAHPVTGARDAVVVNASFGLGESVVAGTVTPDALVVDRDDLAVREHAIADKRRMTVAVPGGTREVPVPGRLARMPAIDAAQASAAAALALALEREMGWPVDLEVAWAGSELFLLQCRPITTLSTDRSTA